VTISDDRIATTRSAWGLGGAADAEAWRNDGLCAQVDPELWYPEKGGSTKDAKSVCLGCPVQTECLQYALDNDERFGIWGGYSERERRALKRGERVTPTLTNKPNRRENGHGFRCTCADCRPEKPRRVCQGCGGQFAGHGLAKYCSISCRDMAYGRKRTEGLKCVVCGTGFVAERRDAKYCSTACSQAKRRPNPLTVTCIVCGSPFTGNRRSRCCSQDCRRSRLQAYHRDYYRQHRSGGAA